MEVLVAERRSAPFLECRDTDERLHLFRTAGREERPLSVGRGPDMDFAIVWDPKVSSLHAELACVGGEWTVTDVGSTNGTFLNEERIRERRRLHDGDRVRVGRHRACVPREPERECRADARRALPGPSRPS